MIMGCGGFTCSKNALCALNILYILVGILLVGVSVASRTSGVLTSFTILGGIVACGVFLMIIAIAGLIGAVKHHQVLLFFYMVVLFLLFLVQFIVACACLAISQDQQRDLLTAGWQKASPSMKDDIQHEFDCCGFDGHDNPNVTSQASCATLLCCTTPQSFADCCRPPGPSQAGGTTQTGGTTQASDTTPCPCEKCYPALQDKINEGLHISGGIGLFFSFTEFAGVILAAKYRNLKDPRADPTLFL